MAGTSAVCAPHLPVHGRSPTFTAARQAKKLLSEAVSFCRSAPRLDGASGMPPAAVSTDPSPPVLAQSQPLQPQGQENGGDISAAPQAVAAAAAQEPASVFSESVQRTIDLAKAPRPPEPSQEQRAEIMVRPAYTVHTCLGTSYTLRDIASASRIPSNKLKGPLTWTRNWMCWFDAVQCPSLHCRLSCLRDEQF